MGGERDLYQGYALQAVDKKGRLSIPSDLRAPLIHNSGGARELMIGDEPGLPCMVAYDRAWSLALKARFEDDLKFARDNGEEVNRAVSALTTFGNVDSVQFDEAGRFILPGFVIEDLELTDFAFFSGAADVFHIWNPRQLIADTRVPESTRRRCAYEMKVKGVAL